MLKDISSLSAGDLYLMFCNNDINVADYNITSEQLLDVELLLMDILAVKRAGSEALVCWEPSEELH
jgi:hypothetical protein